MAKRDWTQGRTMPRQVVTLRAEQVEWLQEYAVQDDRSLSSIVRSALDCYRAEVERAKAGGAVVGNRTG